MPNIQLLTDRYRKRIAIDPETECWLWQGKKSSTGRGSVRLMGRIVSTHRLFFELFIGPVPHGMELHHKCRVAHCCNPDHLSVVTRLSHRRLHGRYRSANQEKSQCKRGHPFDSDNTYIEVKNGATRRHCRTCRKEYARLYYLGGKD